jgi:predicted RNase H-like HicB family nuclease
MTLMILRDVANEISLEYEELPDGSSVWVASDLQLDGCIAQGATRDEAISALADARAEYLAVQRELLNRTPSFGISVLSSSIANASYTSGTRTA